MESFIISSDNETFDSNLVSYFGTEAYSKYTETEKWKVCSNEQSFRVIWNAAEGN